MTQKNEVLSGGEILTALPQISFIYFLHGPRVYSENDPLIALLADSDLILSETVGLSIKERGQIENNLNLVLADPTKLTPEKIQERARLLMETADSIDIDDQIASHFAGTGKVVRFIDISDQDTDVITLIEKGISLRDTIINALNYGNLKQALGFLHQLIEVEGEEITRRDIITAGQVPDLVNGFAGSKRKVAVLQGAIHCQTASLFKTANPEFPVDIHCLNPLITPLIQICLNHRLDLPVSEIEYRRALLADYILLPALDSNFSQRFNESVLEELVCLVAVLTDEQIDAAFSQFDVLYRQHLFQLIRRRRLTAKEKEIYAPFAFNQTTNSLLKTIRRWVPKNNIV